jgi:hypothetical protein
VGEITPSIVVNCTSDKVLELRMSRNVEEDFETAVVWYNDQVMEQIRFGQRSKHAAA